MSAQASNANLGQHYAAAVEHFTASLILLLLSHFLWHTAAQETLGFILTKVSLRAKFYRTVLGLF
jgi:predicted membrane channel-forming protein YqfA (hemolysin III family)